MLISGRDPDGAAKKAARGDAECPCQAPADRPGQDRHPVLAGAEVLRLVLYVEVQGGKAHAAKHSLPRLPELFEGLGSSKGTPGGDHQPPLLLAGVARLTQHASKSLLLLTLSHRRGSDLGDDR